MFVTLTNGNEKEVTTLDELFWLHFGTDLIGSGEYIRVYNLLRTETDGPLWDVVFRERTISGIGRLIATETVRAHTRRQAIIAARELHLPGAMFAWADAKRAFVEVER